VRRLNQLAEENQRLKRLLADQLLATAARREALETGVYGAKSSSIRLLTVRRHPGGSRE
jgi:hypothetical protein